MLLVEFVTTIYSREPFIITPLNLHFTFTWGPYFGTLPGPSIWGSTHLGPYLTLNPTTTFKSPFFFHGTTFGAQSGGSTQREGSLTKQNVLVQQQSPFYTGGYKNTSVLHQQEGPKILHH